VLGSIEAFDPDILVQFSTKIPTFVSDLGLRIVKPEEIWDEVLQGNSLTPKFGIGIFEILNDVFSRWFKYKPKYPTKVILPQIPSRLSLFWTSWFGEFPPTVAARIEEDYAEALEIESAPLVLANLKETTAANVLFPRRLAQYGLVHHPSRHWSRGRACVFFLDAGKVADVIDCWNLRALGRPTLPIPKQLKLDSGLSEIAADFVRLHRRPVGREGKERDHTSFIRARSCSFDEMRAYAQALNLEREPDDSSEGPFFGLRRWYPRFWDPWARDKEDAIPNDVYGEDEESAEVSDTSVRFRSFLPAVADRGGYHGAPRCANEVTFSIFGADQHFAEVFPKTPGENLRRAISGIASFRDWRVGRNGLVKLVEYESSEGRAIPAAESVFFAWLRDAGWRPKLSVPGLLGKEIYRRLEGNPIVLKNKAVLDLLERMNGGRAGEDLGEKPISEGKELNVGEVKQRLAGSPDGDNLHAYLISRGVFKLGSRVQCPRCQRNSWYSLENLSDTLRCPKCLNAFDAIGNVAAPEWSYKTAGPFSVPRYADGAFAVLLTLEAIGGERISSRRVTPVLSFVADAADGRTIEADLAMLWEEEILGARSGGVLFGECKTYGLFTAKGFRRMRYLAATFPGAVLVFSTLRESLTAGEVRDQGHCKNR